MALHVLVRVLSAAMMLQGEAFTPAFLSSSSSSSLSLSPLWAQSAQSLPSRRTDKMLEVKISDFELPQLLGATKAEFRPSLGNDQEQAVHVLDGRIHGDALVVFALSSTLSLLRVEVWVSQLWKRVRLEAALELPVEALLNKGQRTIVTTEYHQTLVVSNVTRWAVPCAATPLTWRNDKEWGQIMMIVKSALGQTMPPQIFDHILSGFHEEISIACVTGKDGRRFQQ